jgi:HD-GYP domain-containing protein (c-di-GMP phosphodiesterase class II)
MPTFKKLSKIDIKLGEPLSFSVYDKTGTLLLKAGCAINLERHLQLLIDNGLYCNPDEVASKRGTAAPQRQEEEAANTFLILDSAKIRLYRVFQQYRAGNLQKEFLSHIENIAITVQEACSHDTDAALANLHLDYESSYGVVHHVQAAILCELIAKKLGVKEESRLALLKAALTHDLGMLDIQDQLDRQTTPLTAEQREEINAHPTRSVKMLRTLGVATASWLDAVLHHHERLDGSGYPDGISGDALSMPARILAVADIYSAMVRDRPYRKALVSKDAMRSMLLEQGNKTDSRLIQMMIKEVGVFPPGAIVQLSNKEIAVVKLRQENSACPIVFSFIRDTGMPMLSPMRRETSKDCFNIEGIVPFSKYRGSIAIIRGLWVSASA